ncbi:MAG: carbohydrate kinase [Salinibacter sp.]
MATPILCGGEILLDFISRDRGSGLGESVRFDKRPGGSIFNVVVGLSRLGVSASFLTKLGNDEFGQGLRRTLEVEGAKTDWVLEGADLKTTLAFVAVNEEGKPEFRFYRDRVADTRLTTADVARLNLDNYAIYHFGSIAMLEAPSAETYLELHRQAQHSATLTSFDPNVRASMIEDREAFLAMVQDIARSVDILKLSDEDLQFLVGDGTLEAALDQLPLSRDALTVITSGSEGATGHFNGHVIHVPGLDVAVAETTGCGDAFTAALLFQVWNRGGLDALNEPVLMEILGFANAAAGLVATRYGGADSMPSLDRVQAFRRSR